MAMAVSLFYQCFPGVPDQVFVILNEPGINGHGFVILHKTTFPWTSIQ